MTDFTSITQVKRRALPSARRSVYFEVSSRWCQGSSPTSRRRSHLTHMLPSQPGTTEAQRIALFGAQRLAVHLERDETVVQRLFHRDRAGHRRGVSPFRQHPFAVGLHAGFFQQVAQRHTGIDHVVDHAVGELAAIQLRAAPLHAAIGRAFEEVDPVFAREALQVLHGEDQRRVDQAVDHQPVIGRIDDRRAAMVTLEAQPVRRDDAVKLMQRREVDRGNRIGGQPRHIAAHDMASNSDGFP
jgi:hypothetical protein